MNSKHRFFKRNLFARLPFPLKGRRALRLAPSQGFTLVELLVAVILTSIVILIAWTGLLNALSLSQVAEAKAARQTELNRALDFMTTEIRMARSINETATVKANGTSIKVADVVASSGLNLNALGNYGDIGLYLERPTTANIPSVCPAGGPNAGAAPPAPANYDRVVYDVRSSPEAWLGPKILMRYGRVPNENGTIDPCKNPVSSDPIADALTNSTTSTPSCAGVLSGSPGFYVCSENNQHSLYFQSSISNSTVQTITSAVSSRLQAIQPTALTVQNCINEGAARSLNSDVPAELSLLNQKTVPVKVYWLDWAGARQFYADLAPNQKITFNTFLTHPWVVTDTSTTQTCLGIYWPTEGSSLAVIN